MSDLANSDRKSGGNLILIGFMGTGKSTVGKRVAKRLNYLFVDTDEEIERRAGKPIKDIFADSGEAAFRQLESEVLAECCSTPGKVISTGGGIVVNEANHSTLKNGGYVIWLKASAKVVYDRVRRNHDRPLLETNDPQSTIREMLNSRKPLYKVCSDLPIRTDELSLEETIYGITVQAQYWQVEGRLPRGHEASGEEE